MRIPDTDPIWETKYDQETGELYWVDIETGHVAYFRPQKGTFVSEAPLRDFRKYTQPPTKKSTGRLSSQHSIKSMNSSQTTKSINRRSMKLVKRAEDFAIVSGEQGDLNFSELFGSVAPTQFDAGALFGAGEVSNSTLTSKPSSSSSPSSQTQADAPKIINMRRLSTRDGGETPDFPIIEEEVIVSKSTMVTDNPLFRY